MNTPTHLAVGPYEFRVVVGKKAIKERPELDESTFGLSSLDKQTIWLSKMARDCEADTLLHELLHMCSAIGGGHSDDAEEAFIRRVTPFLLATLRDNPELVPYLLERPAA